MCGIYAIVNLVNSKLYIGSTMNFNKRRLSHFSKLRKGQHPNSYLQNAYHKYGKENFVFIILKQCTSDMLISQEQRFIDFFGMEILYNIRSKAEANFGVKFTKEECERISIRYRGNNWSTGYKNHTQPHSEATKQRLREVNLGKRHAESTKELLRQQQLGKPKSPEAIAKRTESRERFFQTEEARQKIGDNNPRVVKTQLINPNGEVVDITNIAKFARMNNVDEQCIRHLVKGKIKTHRGWSKPLFRV